MATTKNGTATTFDQVEGHELLKPFADVRGSDQLRLLSALRSLGVVADEDASDVHIDDLDFEKVADFIDHVSERFAVDSAAFDAFTAGNGGYARAINLAVAYAGELGNAKA